MKEKSERKWKSERTVEEVGEIIFYTGDMYLFS